MENAAERPARPSMMLEKLGSAFQAFSLDTDSMTCSRVPSNQEEEDDVDLEKLIEEDTMHGEKDNMVYHTAGSHNDEMEGRESPCSDYMCHDIRLQRAVDITHKKGYLEDSTIPKSMSLPLDQITPNPFPELANSPLTPSVSIMSGLEVCRSSPSSPLLRRQSIGTRQSPPSQQRKSSTQLTAPEDDDFQWRPKTYNKMMLNVYNEDLNHRTVSIDTDMTASDLCHLLVLKNHAVEDKNWTIVEYLAKFQLERSLEDHEMVLSIYNTWNNTVDNKFFFRKDFRKYAMFQNPTQFFPLKMMDIRETSSWDLLDKEDRHKNLLLKNLFISGEQLPDIQGILHYKEGKKSWKKAFFILRSSGLYYSSKGVSKEPRHLVLFADISQYTVYLANNAKRTFGAHSSYCFCLKPVTSSGDQLKDFKILCADDEQCRMCWLSGLRLNKEGSQLTTNYKAAVRREDKLRNVENKSPLAHSDEDLYVKSRVAMDFTGPGGRVVDDPNEAIGVAIEEGHQWRKKAALAKARSPLSQSPTNTLPNYMIIPDRPVLPTFLSQIHFAQPWFHCGISREDAVQLITSHGLVDGVFLIRHSNNTPGTFVLSLAHNQKVKHCQIIPVTSEGERYYSLDGGYTKFTDLLQLVEFYQVNLGGLPTKLKHYVTRLP